MKTWVNWKFTLSDGYNIYVPDNLRGLKKYWNIRDRHVFDAYVLTKQGWKFVVHNVPSDTCNCGRKYDDNPTGEVFKYQDYPLQMRIKDLTELMRSPVLCMICYYRKEIAVGNWAPKNVKKQLGLES